ncbi:hypothetical protein E2C01_053379 [Portunus trituberculatus]|uniref:Uncharacterized protein n=1 Tax=Portunus trituberculatus TaxID=210409 RepID=A0A5B7GGY4_PORTR|nr:hypothetical protein [Portunus trituberculatus]
MLTTHSLGHSLPQAPVTSLSPLHSQRNHHHHPSHHQPSPPVASILSTCGCVRCCRQTSPIGSRGSRVLTASIFPTTIR